ncbi:Lectin-domain containing receptor kinase A4.3 [Hordeum vulgare]|nr:Lectin-domain containing receptor kinase A4.3 [Hordeum vulgare]
MIAPAMDDDLDLDLDATAGLASLMSNKGKPRASRKAAVLKPKKVLMAEQRAKESAKRKDRRHTAGARDEAIVVAAAQQQVTNARVAAATREALCMLGLNPSQHDLGNAAVAAAASRLSGECSPEVSVVVPSTPTPTTIDLNATLVVGGLSSGDARKRVRQTPANQLPGASNLFDRMLAADNYMENMIFEGGAQAAIFDPDETPRQDGRGYNEYQAAFMHDQVGVGLDLDGFPLDQEFPEDYGLEEEDECNIEADPLFGDELANQADGTAPKRKSKRTKGYTTAEDKLLCKCWRVIGQDPKTGAEQKHSTFWIRVDREFHERKKFPPYQIESAHGWVSISKHWRVIHQECNKFCATLESVKARPVSGIGVHDMAFQALEAFTVQHNGKCFNLPHCFRQIKDEEKFKAQYVGLKSHGGKQSVEEVGDGEMARPRGKTNFKKEDNRDAASIASIATVEGMITKKYSREEKHRQEREEQINAFLEL